jgi:hypothetical protein
MTKKSAKKKPRRKAGRPPLAIDWDTVGKMLEAGAMSVEVAAYIGIDTATLYRRCQQDLSVNFETFKQQKLAKGDVGLRAKQYQVAMSGDKAMLIWLGKQRLNQAEISKIEQLNREIRIGFK